MFQRTAEGPDFNKHNGIPRSQGFLIGGILKPLANVASGVTTPPENQPEDLSRNLRYGAVGVLVVLAVAIGTVLVLLVNWLFPSAN